MKISKDAELNLIAVVKALLKSIHVTVPDVIINKSLKSHPDYPSMACISDTLDEWGISSMAVKLKERHLNEIAYPAIAYCKRNNTKYFVVLRSLERGTVVHYYDSVKGETSQPVDEFKQLWSGVTLILDPTHAVRNIDFRADRNRLLLQQMRMPAVAAVMAILVLTTALLHASLTVWLLLILKLAGALVAVSLMDIELGKEGNVLQRFCKVNSKVSCAQILTSRAAKPFGWLSMAEIGALYFAGGFFTAVLSLFAGQSVPLLYFFAIANLLALPYTFFSIYYQARVIKHWCVLCVTTQVLLWLEFALLAACVIPGKPYAFDYFQLAVVIWGYLTPAALWMYFKKHVQLGLKASGQEKELSAYKRNSQLFEALLERQPYVDTTSFPVEVVLGDAEAPVTVTMVTNPYCSPCARMHAELEKLLKRFPEELKLTLRFMVNGSRPEDERNLVAKHIISTAIRAPHSVPECLHDWYKEKNYAGWKMQYPKEDLAIVDRVIEYHSEWVETAKVEVTPTVYINGRRLPEEYTIEDLKYHVRNIVKVTSVYR